MNHLSEQQIKELEKDGYTILSNDKHGASVEKDGEKFYQYSLLGGLLDKAYNKVKQNR